MYENIEKNLQKMPLVDYASIKSLLHKYGYKYYSNKSIDVGNIEDYKERLGYGFLI